MTNNINTMRITGDNCPPPTKTVCETVHYKELQPREIITLCYQAPLGTATQRSSTITNINKQRTNGK